MKTSKTAKKSAPQPKSRSSADAIYKTVKKFEGGVREKAQAAIPKNGATIEKIVQATKFPEHKVRGYVTWLARNGYFKKISSAA